MLSKIFILIIMLLSISDSAVGQIQPYYEIFGLTVGSTIDSVKIRYPNSKINKYRVRVSHVDSHDGIRSITFSNAYNRVGFNENTKCITVFNKIYRKFKGPNLVRHGYEVMVKTHYRQWSKGNERLALGCYERNGIRYAERISFTKILVVK